MPRTTTLDCPGCPPLRALTFDVLGLIKVVEVRSKQGGIPKVVERWGEPDSSKCIVAASMDDSEYDPLLAVGRRSGQIEVINPLNGEVRASTSNAGDIEQSDGESITGLHLFKKQRLDTLFRSCMLLTCSSKGNASMRSINISDSSENTLRTWNICGAGNILCSKVDESESYVLFGGKGFEVNVWDINQCAKIWTAKSLAKNSLGIYTAPWFTSATFLDKSDHRKFVAGTNNHQVRLYDISAQRRPVMSLDFRDCPIKAVSADLDGNTIYVGNGSGDLASFDTRTGKMLGCFLGKCSGSIRSIARHPELPVIASCGLDGYLRLWDVKTRQLLSATFLKQHLTNVVFDSHFSAEETADTEVDPPPNETRILKEVADEVDEMQTAKRKKESIARTGNEKKRKQRRKKAGYDSSDDEA